MGISRTVSEINGDFGRKSQIPRVFNTPLRKFPLEFCDGGSAQKKLGPCPPERVKTDDIWIRLDTMPRCDGRTD